MQRIDRFRDGLIPRSQLLTLASALLFHFFEIIKRWAGMFDFFYHWLRRCRCYIRRSMRWVIRCVFFRPPFRRLLMRWRLIRIRLIVHRILGNGRRLIMLWRRRDSRIRRLSGWRSLPLNHRRFRLRCGGILHGLRRRWRNRCNGLGRRRRAGRHH